MWELIADECKNTGDTLYRGTHRHSYFFSCTGMGSKPLMNAITYKVRIRNEAEFKEVMILAESMGYYNALEFKHIPHVKTLFLPSDCKHIQWSHRNIDEYSDLSGKEVSIQELKEIAPSHRIESSKSQANE